MATPRQKVLPGLFSSRPPSCIFHSISCVPHHRGPQGVADGNPVKQAPNNPKTREKHAGSVFTACMSMRASA
ncbi:hypothetical protein EIL58_0023060 [Salmonella enterica subsp. enterica serovar Java]|uniref:Uncharacterized protein n=1 Tax=Salmonella enterica subsp. enterica serovar Java TaxID=224729 RepID=A0A651UUE2_SALEB|nr:hypothetical protein EIL58_0023060 [Salmonella enterica subsp. enterica serovar Java]